MKHFSLIRYTALAVLLSVCGAFATFASIADASAAPLASKSAASANLSDGPSDGPSDDLADLMPNTAGNVAGNLAELQDLVKSGRLTELRATRNGSYGAKLYFLPQEVLYYVALSQDTQFWRVVKSQEANRAESVYAQFARKSYELADGEIHRTQLQAQKALLERVIAVSADRANRLTADLALAQQQDSQVSQRQQQLQAESASLQSDKLEAERKLRALQVQVDQLQRATEAGLTPITPTSSR